MHDLKYIGICKSIDWTNLHKMIENQEPAYVGPRHRETDPVEGVNEVGKLWRDAGHKPMEENGSARWDMFLPQINFPETICNKFADWVGLDGYTNCWVSRILPGHMAPYHWDVTDDENTLQYDNHVRYHVHFGPCDPAHTLIVENTCFHNQPQGATWLWPSRTAWHCGMNGGFSPKYLFNFWHRI